MRRRLAGLGAIAALLALNLTSGASAQPPGLDFVAPESVAVTLSDDGSTDEASVWLENASGRTVAPTFKAVLENSDGGPATSAVLIAGKVKPLPPNDVGRYRVYLEEGEESSGQLVATAPSLAPATAPISVAHESVVDQGVNGALLYPLAAAFVLVLIAWSFIVRGVSLTSPLGTLELDFTKSFASTLTAAGALLGTIISAGVLPEQTVYLSKEAFTGLNLIFGIAIVVAGLICTAAQTPTWQDNDKDPKKQERKFQGYVVAFLVASLITVWAVFGELWTLWLLVEELGQDEGFTGLAVIVVKVLLGGAAVAMVPYTLLRISGVVKSKREKPAAAGAFGPAEPKPLQTIALL